MAGTDNVESLLTTLQNTVEEVLAYFEGPGTTSKARVGDWGSWEVLAHFLYWHERTATGMESVALGTGPVTITGETDATNAESIKAVAGKSFQELVSEARRLQKQLDTAARKVTDLDAVVMVRPEAPEGQTARQRLERLARHWLGHTEALRAQG
ncbi:MAG: hypothetical protein V3S37_06150 [Dehalococcoidia bacterium]